MSDNKRFSKRQSINFSHVNPALMISFIIAIAMQTTKDHSSEWLTIATLAPVVYLLLKKRNQGLIQNWITRLLIKKNKKIDRDKPGGRLLLSILLALGLGLLFSLVSTWELAVAVGLGGFLLGLIVVFKKS
jgi:hypothetical protein